MTVSVYKVDDAWVVADNGTWLPGCYDTKDTACAAATFSDSVLAAVEPICQVTGSNRPITLNDLKEEEAKHND